MLIEKFVRNNAFHDAYITEIKYDLKSNLLKLNLVQLYSELDIENSLEVELTPDDLVEIEIVMENVLYISRQKEDFDAYIDYDIYDLFYGKVEEYDVLIFQLRTFEDYEEIYVRGENIKVNARIVNKLEDYL